MLSALKKLFAAKASKTTQGPPPAPIEDLEAWRAANPAEAEAWAAESPRFTQTRCPKHDIGLVTTMGYRSPLHGLPSGDFIDAAMDNPFCLDVGEGRAWYARGIPTRLVFCPECEAGMRARGL